MTPLHAFRAGSGIVALLAVVLGAGLSLGGCASSSSRLPVLEEGERAGRLARWDQTRVTRIATQLVDAATQVQDALRSQPTPTVGSGQWAAYYRLQQNVRRVRLETRQLANMLDSGKGYAETITVYETLDGLVNDCALEARRIFVHSPVMDAIVSAGSLLNQLAPYYDPKALTGP